MNHEKDKKKGFRLTIGRKIGIGFGVLIFLTLINFFLTFYTIQNSKKISDSIVEVYTPSLSSLDDLNTMIVRSKMLISNWVFMQRPPEDPDKLRLKKLIKYEYPELKKEIERLAVHWTEDERLRVDTVFKSIDTLFAHHEYVMNHLNSFMSYEDVLIVFEVRPMVEDGEISSLTNSVLTRLEYMVGLQHKKTKNVSNKMVRSFDVLLYSVQTSGTLLVIGGIIIAFFTIRTIVGPINSLKLILLSMSKGVMPTEPINDREDEIGEMSAALNLLIDALKRTTKFAGEVGSGKFDGEFTPLSVQDTLGHALLQMRKNLEENERVLEQKVVERTEEVVRQKEEIELKTKELTILYEAVTDSIRYAKRIQSSILPPDQQIKSYLPESFVLYKPKDIVSGDFYWFDHRNGISYIAAVDCTGHGVPGALMSIVGYNVLNQALITVSPLDAGGIVDYLNRGVSLALRQDQDDKASKDGMDISLAVIDHANNKMYFAGAFNPLYILRGNEIEIIKADKFPIGYYATDPEKKYEVNMVDMQPGDIYYLFSDGYADQFGGPKGKKYMYKKFRDYLLSIKEVSLPQQRDLLNKEIEDWRGEIEQIDDILVMGFKIS